MVWLALYNLTSSGSYIFASLVIFVIKKRTCDSLRSRFRHVYFTIRSYLIVGSEHITVFAVTQIGNSSTPLSSLASSSMSSSSLGVGSLRSLSLNSFKLGMSSVARNPRKWGELVSADLSNIVKHSPNLSLPLERRVTLDVSSSDVVTDSDFLIWKRLM